jgi:hypothetical protein
MYGDCMGAVSVDAAELLLLLLLLLLLNSSC